MMGRPSRYSAKLAADICGLLAAGQSLREVCRSETMPSESTVRSWALDDKDGFSAQYTRAREIGYLTMADELFEIADDGSNDWMERQGEDKSATYVLNGEHVQRSRLRVDTRKWMLSKVLPKVFGDKIQHSGDPENPVAMTVTWKSPVKESSDDPKAS
jgi:hypothetical protein